MTSNNFIDTTIDNYYLNPYKFNTTNTNNKILVNNDKNLNFIIKTLTSIITNNSELIDNNQNNNDKQIIFKLIANNDIDKLINILDNNKSLDINSQDNDGDTPLHIAIFLSNYNACKVLIQYNADIFIKDKWGQTPLHRLCFALENKNIIKIIDLINIKYNNNIFNTIDIFNNTPLHLVIKYILKNKIKLSENILSILYKIISLTNIELINNDKLSSKDLLNILNITV
jgi:ankyrin repeat protein